ncbi:YajC [alpha proteobacterium IMCC14465]|uniref:Sec translocon accessory complex subunit YajC n=1 Tax=alpha proteobacterium IMCC14465 TaxID=1220535 RepID=J9E1F5_9PROT|nr:YajC [alpha proteobacterium IMCC14465]
MFITQAFAQSAPAPAGSLFDLFFPLAMVFLIVYFMIIRPQSKRQKEHQSLIDGLRRGDTVVTQGGLIGKIAKVDEDELQIDIAKDVRISIVRSMILTVRSKTEPAEKK